MHFEKYQALGNDYFVLSGDGDVRALTREVIGRVCDRNYGFGSDGILVDEGSECEGVFKLRIFNPDGSEAERSGNGLRIFTRYLYDRGLIGGEEIILKTPFSETVARFNVESNDATIVIDGAKVERQAERLIFDDGEISYYGVNVGNPHAVVIRSGEVTKEEVLFWGPKIENHGNFPDRTNVQFVNILDENNVRIEIWERGVGYTLSSGTSAAAVSRATYALGLTGGEIVVHMVGGILKNCIDVFGKIHQTGPIGYIGYVEAAPELIFKSILVE